ncbi:MAG: 6-carboxytetrahydropterin synthase QueD [Deltaproteobacteria bacterium]|nr:6-carboxytetrahydropterin synthase QueD [Deltaproteobacteria bacterium]MBW1952619.1 6-carboxytetrahydropterin synthase QueD [Deltaproteobacteria bacterium]MBW1986254.1 6-carboxytetrahydropterin synthase QueD [Deltaproteobacteria bacterium]MBW2134151.1 6-carboxytetrahydropterin synthase QueD [Deltaproteobacteria bacterium]
MYELKIITQFSAAHRLENFYGKCEALHGHNWKVEIFVVSASLDDAGLVRDFGQLKAAAKEILEEVDHTYLNELPAFRTQNPSSENLARYLFERLGTVINDGQVKVTRVTVWESDTSSASYYLP